MLEKFEMHRDCYQMVDFADNVAQTCTKMLPDQTQHVPRLTFLLQAGSLCLFLLAKLLHGVRTLGFVDGLLQLRIFSSQLRDLLLFVVVPVRDGPFVSNSPRATSS